LKADFLVNLQNVNPFDAIQNAANSLSAMLGSVSDEFQTAANGFITGFSSAALLLSDITDRENLQLTLDVVIDLSVVVKLSFDASPSVSVELRALSTALSVQIQDTLSKTYNDLAIIAAAGLQLLLDASNRAVPFDILTDASKLTEFVYGGSLDSRSFVTIPGVPATIILEASVPDVAAEDAEVDFTVSVDIDLYPIRQGKYSLLLSVNRCLCVFLSNLFEWPLHSTRTLRDCGSSRRSKTAFSS
jgi:hypothetical protein